jgi:hypothetical protein
VYPLLSRYLPNPFPDGSRLIFATSFPGPTLPPLAGEHTAGSYRLCMEMICSLVMDQVFVLFQAMGNRPASACSAGVSSAQIQDRSCVPPFPVLCPSATHYSATFLCFACVVPMRPATHNEPSPTCLCTYRPCVGKIQGRGRKLATENSTPVGSVYLLSSRFPASPMR